MLQVARWMMIFFVTTIITVFVVDFQSVVDGFTAVVDALSSALAPLKAIAK